MSQRIALLPLSGLDYQAPANVIDSKMKMSPTSRSWENHIRSLAAAIILRGADHTYSKANFQLLASSRLLLVRMLVTLVEMYLY